MDPPSNPLKAMCVSCSSVLPSPGQLGVCLCVGAERGNVYFFCFIVGEGVVMC